VMLCVAVSCSVLQCVAVCCSVLQCVAMCCSVLQCVAVCCSVLQRVAHHKDIGTSLLSSRIRHSDEGFVEVVFRFEGLLAREHLVHHHTE